MIADGNNYLWIAVQYVKLTVLNVDERDDIC